MNKHAVSLYLLEIRNFNRFLSDLFLLDKKHHSTLPIESVHPLCDSAKMEVCLSRLIRFCRLRHDKNIFVRANSTYLRLKK